MASAILGSWKEIAAYLGKGVRTVQRWEQTLGLPVRRPRGGNRQGVVALPSEIDCWVYAQLRVGGATVHPAQPGRVESSVPAEIGESPQAVQAGWRGTVPLASDAPLVLVVDDNEVQRYAISRTLQHRGFRTVVARDAEEAFRILVQQNPEIILSDIVLPDTTGLDLCRRIRQESTIAARPVVFYSALTATECENHGGDAFLTYPVSEDILTDVLQAALRRYTV